MKTDVATTAKILTDLVREDRAEARIWRTRLETLASTATLASFAITAFLISRLAQSDAGRLRFITCLADGGLIAVTTVLFIRVRLDLISLRKGQRHRQNLLNAIEDGKPQDIDPFTAPDHDALKPVVSDRDLYWISGAYLGLMLVKMFVVAVFASDFLPATQTR
jgi:hypothetical protein